MNIKKYILDYTIQNKNYKNYIFDYTI